MTTLFIAACIPWLMAISGIGVYRYFRELSVLVIPILGFVTILTFSCVISAILELSGTESVFSSFLLLSIFGIFTYFRISEVEKRKKIVTSCLIFASFYYFVYLVFLKFEIFFGVHNFDFFYNIQDGIYLQRHSIYKFEPSDSIFPLGWSADPMGRFAPSLLFSLLNFFSDRPIFWAGAVFVLVITLYCLGFVLFFRTLVQKPSFFLMFLLLSLIVLNSLTLFSWRSNLLGQISGLPVLLTVFTVFTGSRFQQSQVRVFVQLVFLIIGLYWIYPAMFLIASPLMILILIRIFRVQGIKTGVKNTFYFLVALTVTVYPNFDAAISRLLDLVFFTQSNSQDDSIAGNLVFNQFSSWFGPLLSIGYVPYPNKIGNYKTSILYLFLAVVVFFLFWSLRKRLVRVTGTVNFYPRTDLQVLASYLSVIYLFIFIFLKSNYFLFKVSTWFSPLLIGVFLIYVYNSTYTKKNFAPYLLLIFVSPIIISGLHTGINYLQNRGENFPLAKNGLEEEFVSKFLSSGRSLAMNLPTSEESAWVALSAGSKNQGRFFGLTPGKQVLESGFAQSCATNPVLSNDVIIVSPDSTVDIFPPLNRVNESRIPQVSQGFQIIPADGLRLLLVSNSGLFNPNQSEGWPFFKGSFYRWSNGFLCVSIWNSASSKLDIRFPLQEGPDWNNSVLEAPENGSLIVEDLSIGLKLVSWKNILLEPGWNNLRLRVSNVPEYMSTSSTNPDFRPLSFAVGEISISKLVTVSAGGYID